MLQPGEVVMSDLFYLLLNFRFTPLVFIILINSKFLQYFISRIEFKTQIKFAYNTNFNSYFISLIFTFTWEF